MTTSILRGSRLSRLALLNEVSDFGFHDEEVNKVTEEIIAEVNRRLPSTLYWMPDFSEIWAEVNDETRISEEEFADILRRSFAEVVFS